MTRKIDGIASLGIDVNSRSFLLDGDVDENMLRTAWSSLAALGVSKPVTCFLSSGGGDLDMGFAIYDLFRNFENTLNIVAIGGCCSAATVILLAGDNKLITANSFLMIHQGTISITSDESPQNTDKWLDHYKVYTNRMIKLYSDRMNIPVSKLKKLLQTDQLYIGEEAVKAGLVDAIWDKKGT